MICKNESIYNDFLTIIQDKNFQVRKYVKESSRVKSYLDAQKINIEIAVSLVDCYNVYYRKQYRLEGLFLTSAIKDYVLHKDKIQYGYSKGGISSFIDKILHFVLHFPQYIYQLIAQLFQKNTEGEGAQSDRNNEIMKFIIYAILGVLLCYLAINIIQNVYNQQEQSSHIHKGFNTGPGR